MTSFRTSKECRALIDVARPVPLPVDITDEDQFPEMARASRHAAKLREAKHV